MCLMIYRRMKMSNCQWKIYLCLSLHFIVVVCGETYCSKVGRPLHGDIITSNKPPYTVGSVITYKCDKGFQIQGNYVTTCLINGKWSHPAPLCKTLSCKRDFSKIEKGRHCRKPCQTDAHCRGGKKRCVCDDWCGKSCFNPSATCPVLSKPENGFINGDMYSYGYSVTYGCNEGFILAGPETRKCRSDRKWSGYPPRCLALETCGQNGLKEGSLFTGKVISGTDVQVGAWPWQVLLFTNSKHLTKQIYDPHTGFGGGSIINNKWILTAAHVIYERFPIGFIKKDWKKRFLIAAGMTKHPAQGEVIPEHVDIFEPKHVYSHPKFDGDSYDYDIALIKIGKRLKVDGSKFVVDSQSVGKIVFSRHIRAVCLPCMKGDPFDPVNILERYDANICSKNIRGHNPNIPAKPGDETMVTGFGWKRSTGFLHWDKPKVMQQGRLKIQTDQICIDSVKLMQQEEASARYTDRMICAKSADKSKNIDACEGDSGGPLVKRFGSKQASYWMQVGIVSWGWGCGNLHPGFYTAVSSVMPWVWSVLNETKTDVSDFCLKPPSFEHAVVDTDADSYQVNDVVKFTCKQGYVISGKADIFCQPDLTWSSPKFSCKKVNCNRPQVPRNGYIKGDSYLFGDFVEYKCEQGYHFPDLAGRSAYRRRCKASGTWSGESVNCEREIVCPTPTIRSGIFKGVKPFKVGSMVSFVCNQGYRLMGESSVTCNDDGTWSSPLPVCEVYGICDFDGIADSLCGYTNEDDGKLERLFVMENTLSGKPNYVLRTTSTPAVLRSPLLLGGESHCFKFYYHIHELDGDDDFVISLGKNNVIGKVQVKEKKNTWLNQQITLNPSQILGSSQFSIIVKGKNTKIDLDDFSLTTGECVSNCEADTCLNGGTCIDRIGTYTCFCSRYYKGTNCEREILCSTPEYFPRGAVKAPSKIRIGTRVSYECNPGYRARGTTFAICSENGKLSSDPPECRRIAVQTKSCPDQYKELVLTCYRQFAGPKNYEEAKKVCEKDGGQLANIQSKRVNDFLWDNTWGSSADYWIGLHTSNFAMLWSNGESFERGHGVNHDLTNVAKNNCGKYYYSYHWSREKTFQIRFDDCSKESRFICEKWKDGVSSYDVLAWDVKGVAGVYHPVSGLLTHEEKRQIYRKENDPDIFLFYEYHPGNTRRNWYIGGYSITLGRPTQQYKARTYSKVREPDAIDTPWSDSSGLIIDIIIKKHEMWDDWSEWECNVKCGSGKRTRFRQCKNGLPGSKDCKGNDWEEGVCTLPPCEEESPKKGPCYPDPCNNRGSCRIGNNGDFMCHCQLQFSGKRCQIDLSAVTGAACPELPPLQNGKMTAEPAGASPPYQPGMSVRFSCNRSYRLKGPQRIECRRSGQWSQMPAICKEVGCLLFDIDLDANAYVKDHEGQDNIEVESGERLVLGCKNSKKKTQILCKGKLIWEPEYESVTCP